MLRLSRRLTTILLWIGIALLPLRGAATVLMPTLMLDAAGSTAVVQPADDAAAPCHGTTAASDEAQGTAHNCSLCDLCHSAAAQAPDAPALPSALHDGAPRASAPAAPELRTPEGLFRPPRSLHA
jgi:hypothetical protein